MTDVHDQATRHKNMAAIPNKNTKPEQYVAELLRHLGLEFEAQAAQIPGKPDLYIPKYHLGIFVHGCFWHGHHCHLFKTPQTRTEFWLNKIASNQNRDQTVRKALQERQIRQLIIWECSLKGKHKLPYQELCTRIEEFALAQQQFAEIRDSGFSTGKPSNIRLA